MDQGSNKNQSPAYNFTPTVTKFCVMWEGLSLPHDTKFGNCRCKIVDSRSFHSWSLIHGLRWSGLIKVGPGNTCHPCGHGSLFLTIFARISNAMATSLCYYSIACHQIQTIFCSCHDCCLNIYTLHGSLCQIRGKRVTKFPSNLIWDGKTVGETGHTENHSKWWTGSCQWPEDSPRGH